MASKWNVDDIDDLSGKRVMVTGANSGIGYEASVALAAKGAHVILACRSQEKGERAKATILEQHDGASVALELLNLASLKSVRACAARMVAMGKPLDVLINNAGVMALPYTKTEDGFEMQFGTNHLGHFTLTGLLIDLLEAAPLARVVNVSSLAHKMGKVRFDDLQHERSYEKWSAYGQSKLSNLLFTYELQRRFAQAGSSVIAVACHPGYSSTNLQHVGPAMRRAKMSGAFWSWSNSLVAQSMMMGALPTLYAACSKDVQGGDYIGPDGWFEVRGHPVRVKSNKASHDAQTQGRLWRISEELTGVVYSSLEG